MSCALLVVILVYLFSLGRVSSIHGKEFLITFQENELYRTRVPQSQCVTLTTILENNTAVQVTSLDPDINFNTTVIINNTLSEYVCVDNSIQLRGTGLSRKVVQISADNDISVMVHDAEIYSADSYVAIPVENYGTEYFIIDYLDESQFSVTGKENGTIVSIEFPTRRDASLNVEVDQGGITSINPSHLAFTIQEHEVYQLNMTHDLTGVFVSSNKPVAVISGNRKIFLYSKSTSDHLAEQMPPVDTWGTRFISVPSPSKTKNDIYTILASAPCTSVNVGNETYSLDKKGEWIRMELSSTDPLEIVSDKPILVLKFLTSGGGLEQCMMLVVPRRQWLNHYTFHFPQTSDRAGYLVLVVESQFRNSILLNQEPINMPQWIDVGNSNYSVGYILLPNALYTVHLPETDGYFAAYIQHSHRKLAYCNHIGMKLNKINMGWQKNTCDEDFTEIPSTSEAMSETTSLDVLASTSSTISSPTSTTSTAEKPSTDRWSPYENTTLETCFTPNPQLLNLSVNDDVFLHIIEELKQHLKVVPQKTSQAIRKKISVPDYRPSSTTIGMSWWSVVVVGFIVGILGSDLLKIVKDCRYGFRSIGR